MNIYIRSAGFLVTGYCGYKINKEIIYNGGDIPTKLHIVPTLLSGTIGAVSPRTAGSIGIVGVFFASFIYYLEWQSKVLEEHRKRK